MDASSVSIEIKSLKFIHCSSFIGNFVWTATVKSSSDGYAMTVFTRSQEASTSSTTLDEQYSGPIRFASSPSSRGLTRIGATSSPEFKVEDAVSVADKAKPVSSSASPPASSSPPLFCRRCTNNQRIQLSLLADFEHPTPSGTPTSKQRPPVALSAYRADLDERYPVLCKHCRPGVEKEIERRNRLAQRDIWRARMERDSPFRRISGAHGAVSPSTRSPVRVKPAHHESLQEPTPKCPPRKNKTRLTLVRAALMAGTSVLGIVQMIRGLRVLTDIRALGFLDGVDADLAVMSTLRASLAILDVIMLALDVHKMSSLVAAASSVTDKDEILDADWEHPEKVTEERLDAVAMRRALTLYFRGYILSALVLFLSAVAPLNDTQDSHSAAWTWYLTVIADTPRKGQLHWFLLLGIVIVQCAYTLAIVRRCLLPRNSHPPDISSPEQSPSITRVPTKPTDGSSDAYAAFVPGVSEALASSWTSSDAQMQHTAQSFREATPTPTPMDWQPTPFPLGDSATQEDPDTISPRTSLAPQRFYPPEPPTGLEGLFDRGLTLREDDGEEEAQSRRGNVRTRLPRTSRNSEKKVCFCIGVLNGLVLAAALVAAIWVADLPSSAGDAVTMVRTRYYTAFG